MSVQSGHPADYPLIFPSMRMQLQERAVETKVKDGVLVKQRREEIIRAVSQVFTQKGYHSATIRDICEASGLGPGTLYNYIKKKEDILYLIYNQLTMMLSECLVESIKKNQRDPVEQLREVLGKTIQIIWQYQDLTRLMYQETASLDKESRHNILKRESDYVSLFETTLERGRKRGIIRHGQTQIDADIVVYLLAFIPLRRWNLKKRFQEKEITAGLVDFILRAVLGSEKRNEKRK
ncbi:MAG: TetR/AcrR family transcriptional regulator [Deltaproteobacteria bacterium]|nr:TetR/AcrR family transcriptional regulator [Deltaproteobacteria bacterium]